MGRAYTYASLGGVVAERFAYVAANLRGLMGGRTWVPYDFNWTPTHQWILAEATDGMLPAFVQANAYAPWPP